MKTLVYYVENEQDKASNDRKWFYVILSVLHLMLAKHATFAMGFFSYRRYEIEWLFFENRKVNTWQ